MAESTRDLRAAARAELEVATGARDAPEVDELLAQFFAATPESNTYLEALDSLAQETAWMNVPAGRAASAVGGKSAGTPSDVASALGVPRRQAMHAVELRLGLGADAADLLLDRPAASLVTFEAARVRALAVECQVMPGQLFADIAASMRSSRGYVYAYRPGSAPTTPAKRVTEPSGAPTLLEWGYAFFDLRTSES